MTPFVYYNENDPKAAAWLNELMKQGLIPEGFVDARSIWDVAPEDLDAFTQHHFFAGIGGWAYALALAGWPADRPVWTGSCPCQPFSSAGKGGGFADERHLWPAWQHLIRVCRPPTIFGEQVEAAINHGWLDLVQDDLEGEGYAVGAVGLPAACVGAPHIRGRVWFVADNQSARLQGATGQGVAAQRGASILAARDSELGDTHGGGEHPSIQRPQCRWLAENRFESVRTGPLGGFWGDAEWLRCADDKLRPVEPGTFPLAHGVSARVGRLRGYGNAIVPPLAAEVIRAFMATELQGEGVWV